MAASNVTQFLELLKQREQATGEALRLRCWSIADRSKEHAFFLELRDGKFAVAWTEELRRLSDAIDPDAAASRIQPPNAAASWRRAFDAAKQAEWLSPNQVCTLILGPHFYRSRQTFQINVYRELRTDPAGLEPWLPNLKFSGDDPPLLGNVIERAVGSGSVDGSAAFDRWEERLEEGRADPAWVVAVELRATARQRARTEMDSVLRSFIAGDSDVDTFRATFDAKTRSAWDTFGLKGIAGAMTLNGLVKHAPDRDELTRRLCAVLVPPVDAIAAKAQMEEFYAWLVGLAAQSRSIVAGRIPTLVSACWHAQSAGRWPIYYFSMRRALVQDGLASLQGAPADAYLEFVGVIESLESRLSCTALEIEELCRDSRGVDEHEPVVEGPRERQTWLVSPGRSAEYWEVFQRDGIFALGVDAAGSLRDYATKVEILEALQQGRSDGVSPTLDALAAWEFANEMKEGDLVYAKKGRKQIIGLGVVEGDYEYAPEREGYKHIRRVAWKSVGEWDVPDRTLVMKTLTNITQFEQLCDELSDIVGERTSDADDSRTVVSLRGEESPRYTVAEATHELFRTAAEIEQLRELVLYRKNVILQGPPGVGKTFVAQRLAQLVIGSRDASKLKLVQFHQSYAYEDFVQGYRPSGGGGFSLRKGPFLEICETALQDPAQNYVLVIDEINRGNLSKIFGELLMLVEPDKRGRQWAATLAYSERGAAGFHVPANLHIIGTMNTADRSIAMVDYALRRRFAFETLTSRVHDDAFGSWLQGKGASEDIVARIRRMVGRLNELVVEDRDLGAGYAIGHSYFCGDAPAGLRDDAWLARIIRYELNPLVDEYWSDQRERATTARAILADV